LLGVICCVPFFEEVEQMWSMRRDVNERVGAIDDLLVVFVIRWKVSADPNFDLTRVHKVVLMYGGHTEEDDDDGR